MSFLKPLAGWITANLGIPVKIQNKILFSLLILFIIWLIRRLIQRYGLSKIANVQSRYRFKKTSVYISYITGLLLLASIWFKGFDSFTTYLGLFSAGLAIALKEPITNLAGWLFIVVRHPFEVGDRIELGLQAGDVIDLRMFQFTILEISDRNGGEQSTGRIIHLPNSMIFTTALANYSKGFQFLWNEISVTVTFESNWKKAKQFLQQIADQKTAHHREQAAKQVHEASKRFMIFYSKLTPIVYTRVIPHGVELTIRYLCEPRQRRSSAELIWEEVLETFAANSDLDFAYPTQRFYTLDNRPPRPVTGADQPEQEN